MNIKINVKNIDKVSKLFEGVKNEIKPEVIDKSLDKVLAQDLAKLKTELLQTINNELRSKVTIQSQEGKTEDVVMKRSDQEIIKHLTGVDLQKVSKTKDYNTIADGKLAIVSNKALQKANIDKLSNNPTSKMSSGVNLRLPISDADTFENQYARAVDYYNGAIFVIVENGRTKYYQNPGVDMTTYVKVVCSRETGTTDKSSNRWDKHKEKRGYADWTLLNDGLDKVRRDFIDITDVVEKIKSGDYEEAKNVLDHNSQKSNKPIDIVEKIDSIKSNNTEDSVKAYNNIIQLLRKLRIEKSVKNDRTYYSLISNYDKGVDDYQAFQEKLTSEIKLWKIDNEQKWIDTILKSIINLVNKLLR